MAILSWMSAVTMVMASVINITVINASPEDVLRCGTAPTYRNCWELQSKTNISGIYEVNPNKCCPDYSVKVYCDMETDGGGWTVIQRRDDIQPREDFYRTWMAYALGFGNLEGEFWLGLDHIHALTDQTFNELRIELGDFDDATRYASYSTFYIHPKSQSYKLEVDGYTGDAGDSFSYHNGQAFTTKDKDLDPHGGNCAIEREGAWWYKTCAYSNLNGIYYADGVSPSSYEGVNWYHWHGASYSLKKSEMKIRPLME